MKLFLPEDIGWIRPSITSPGYPILKQVAAPR
jgi:hypothetical protein